MPTTVFHLERFEHFLKRVVALNRLYAPEDPILDLLESGDALQPAGPDDPGTQAAQTKKILHAIHRNFPEQAPLHEQAAYLVRAFTGLAPFPEANHRTGWDFTGELLAHAQHSLLADWDEGRALGTSLWMDLEDSGFAVDSLQLKDAVFEDLAKWFKGRIA